jgi:hypothetical protein
MTISDGDRRAGAPKLEPPDRRPRRNDGAVFQATAVRSGGGSRVVVGLVALGAGALVLVATLEPTPPPSPLAAAQATTGPAAFADPTPSPRPRRTSPPATSGGVRPGPMGGAAAVMAVDLRPAGSHLFVHGEVYSLRVETVIVTLLDVAGHVAETRSLLIPGGSTAFRLGAVPRFDVHFAVPDEMLADGLVIEAHAIDERGEHVALVRAPVTSPRGPM